MKAHDLQDGILNVLNGVFGVSHSSYRLPDDDHVRGLMHQSNKPKGDFKRLVITPGEPAGIGPDITVTIAQESWHNIELIVVAHPDLLQSRARLLGLPLTLHHYEESKSRPHLPGNLTILPIPLSTSVSPGKLNPEHAAYVIHSLELATHFCLEKKANAIITGPVQKSILNEAGIPFTGHTEFFAHLCKVEKTVMLFVVNNHKIALATTHLPLAKVTEHINKTNLRLTLSILRKGLQHYFQIQDPIINVCGLNPHAGENGYLGLEEIEVIAPLIQELRAQDQKIEGPFAADTIFTPTFLDKSDCILAMYHDQALPVVKYMGFGQAINVTLGLPFLRTSVDHGTALSLAGTGQADASSMKAAIQLAATISF